MLGKFIGKIKSAYYKRIGDRRKYLRKPLRVKVTEKVSGVFEHFTSLNVSIGGMFLKTARPFAVGSKVTVEFSLPGNEHNIIAEADVVRTAAPGNANNHPPGMGVKFTIIDESDRSEIKRFVEDPRVS